MEPETIESVISLIRKQPQDAELHQRLGNLYVQAKRLEEARAAFERSIELDPKDPFTYLYLGNMCYHERMYPEALIRFQHAAAPGPDLAVPHWCLGAVYEALGAYPRAQQAFERAVEVEPDDPLAREKLVAWYERRRGVSKRLPSMIRMACSNDQAATTVLLASRWLAAHPDDLEVILDYAKMLYQMTRYEDAIRVYRDAIERFAPARWMLYGYLGHLYRYRGDFLLLSCGIKK